MLRKYHCTRMPGRRQRQLGVWCPPGLCPVLVLLWLVLLRVILMSQTVTVRLTVCVVLSPFSELSNLILPLFVVAQPPHLLCARGKHFYD